MIPLPAFLILVLPFLEIAAFVEVGRLIGLGPTLLLVLASGVAGAALLRAQGLAALSTLRQALGRGAPPEPVFFDRACLMAAGLLLILPGFISDGVALLLLLPVVRRGLRRYLARRFVIRSRGGVTVIEGEFRPVGPEAPHAIGPRSEGDEGPTPGGRGPGGRGPGEQERR